MAHPDGPALAIGSVTKSTRPSSGFVRQMVGEMASPVLCSRRRRLRAIEYFQLDTCQAQLRRSFDRTINLVPERNQIRSVLPPSLRCGSTATCGLPVESS